MKKKRIALLLALALVPCLFACSSAPAAQSPAREAAPTESSTASPAQAAPEPAAPAGEQDEEKQAETTAPEPAEEAEWQRAYRTLLEDPALLDRVISETGEYRKGYFGGWETPWELLPFSSYAAADLNGDGTPELLLHSEEMGLTDLIGWNGDYVYLGYDDYMGFLPEEKAALVHGHWHGAGGSYDQEYSVVSLEEPWKILSYFDRLGEEDSPVWTFQNEDGSWTSGSEEENRGRYESLYAQYVPACIPMAEIPFYPLDDPQGLRAPCDLSSLLDWRELQDAAEESTRSFLGKREWEAAGVDAGQDPQALLWDLDRDGLSELLLRTDDEETTAVFRYDARQRQMALLGSLTGELFLYWGDTPVGREADTGAWYSPRLNGGVLRREDASWVTEDFLSPFPWQKTETLAAGLG